MLPNEDDFVIGNYDNDLQPREVPSASNDAKPDVIRSLPERKAELLANLKALHDELEITKDEFQEGYYNGFEDGCNAIIRFLSGNDV